MQLSDAANIIGKDRYFLEDEDWDGCTQRSAFTVSSVEKNSRQWFNKFHELQYNLNFLGAGRILRNSGRARGSMLNCYHIPIGDSIEEIGDFMREALILWSAGGGVGTTLSLLRPSGAAIMGKGGNSSGPISFLTAADSLANTVESGGSRRAAGLAEMRVSHPDIVHFINCKANDSAIKQFNISVGVTEKFLDAVQNGDDWQLHFNKQDYEKVDAVWLWNTIIERMVEHAEPGIINWDNISTNNSYYFAPISGVNPCGEATLAKNEACDLGSIVLPSFVTDGGSTKWSSLESTIHTSVRFLDNVLDVNKYDLDVIKQAVMAGRRIGLGYIGLAEYLFKKNIRYGSEECIRELERLGKFHRNCAYEASIKLAEEKGAFPKFDSSSFSKAKFVRKLPASIRKDIKKHGIRNVSLLAMPPTGTTSLLADCTSGIEPLFSKAYRRDDRIGSRIYIHPVVKEYKGTTPDWFVDSYDLSPEEHLKVQATVQRYVDGAVSKTINLPKETKPNDVNELVLEYINDLKGVTMYRDGARSGQILNRLSGTEILKHLNTAQSERTEEDVSCGTGACEI